MIPKPTMLPEWASDDVINPINGQYNVVVPPLEKKQAGWGYLEKPNRQWLNWFQRTVYDWIAYFDQNLDFEADLISPVWNGLTNQPDENNLYYVKDGDRVFFSCSITWSANVDNTLILYTDSLPFTSKTVANDVNFGQVITCTRGPFTATLPNSKQILGVIGSGTNRLRIFEVDLATGVGQNVIVKGAAGQLYLTGFYFIDNI